jgi:hypothetical protein
MQMLPPSTVLVKGDELWMYYTGLKTRAPASREPLMRQLANPDNGGICLATIRRDHRAESTIKLIIVKSMITQWVCGSGRWARRGAE